MSPNEAAARNLIKRMNMYMEIAEMLSRSESEIMSADEYTAKAQGIEEALEAFGFHVEHGLDGKARIGEEEA